MALLDMQAMKPARDDTAARWDDESSLSVAICDSSDCVDLSL
jgi:hypothetical protein